MLWKHYFFSKNARVLDTWQSLFNQKEISLLYIAGRGFDLRAQSVMDSFTRVLKKKQVKEAKLLLVDFLEYELSQELKDITEENAQKLEKLFSNFGNTEVVSFGSAADKNEDLSASNVLMKCAKNIVNRVASQTDIILDISSMPRVVFLALLTGLLNKLVPDQMSQDALYANGVNLHVVVAEDASLDARICCSDPRNDLIVIPGYSSALHVEALKDLPLVWFPLLGENRVDLLKKVMNAVLISADAEVCPVFPHPSYNPRRAEQLLLEYKEPLFDTMAISVSDILYVTEANPFEVYRQLFGAMDRYRKSLESLGGCRLVVSPFSSKLITIGAGLACFDMRPKGSDDSYGIAIPYAEPIHYSVDTEALRSSKPQLSLLLLTGEAYGK